MFGRVEVWDGVSYDREKGDLISVEDEDGEK